MRKLSSIVKGGLMTGAALLAALGLGISPASASGTWTVSGGTAYTGTSSNADLGGIKCASSTITVSMSNGTGLSGTSIGSITNMTWTGCTDSLGNVVSLTAQSLPWPLDFTSYASPVTSGTVNGFKVHVSDSVCTFDVAGSTSTSPSTTGITYNDSTKALTFTGTGNLHVWSVSGACLGLFNSGDAIQYTAAYYLNPATLQVTSP